MLGTPIFILLCWCFLLGYLVDRTKKHWKWDVVYLVLLVVAILVSPYVFFQMIALYV